MAKKQVDELDDEFDSGHLPEIVDGETGTIIDIAIQEKKTKPPALYTEDTLIGDMLNAAKFIEDDPELRKQFSREITGIGTAATRAETIEKLKAHKYIALEADKKSFVATQKGIAFFKWLNEVYPTAFDVALTARWEAELSIVAEKGGGKAFEERTYQNIAEMVEILKAAKPMQGLASTTAPENSNMAENGQAPQYTAPTEKMVNFAKVIARNLKIELPPEVETDANACRAFLNEHSASAMRPSPKQLEYAQNIAQRKKLTIPDDVLNDGRKISAWIDENR